MPARGVSELDVLGLSCCCWDLLAIVDRMPELDDKAPMREWTQQGGGQAATAMVAVARLGGKAGIIGRVGDDENGDHIHRAFVAERVDTSGLRQVPGETSQFAICIIHGPTGKRTIFWKPGTVGPPAAAEVSPEQVRAAKVLLVDAHAPEAGLQAAQYAHEAGLPIVLDLEKPSPTNEALIRLSTHPVLPLGFVRALTGVDDPIAAARRAQRLGPQTVVVTLGDRGCVAVEGARVVRLAAYDVPVVDTTGAGDVFHGAFAYGLVLGLGLEDNLRLASAVAALKCRALGGRAGLPSLAEAQELVRTGRFREAS